MQPQLDPMHFEVHTHWFRLVLELLPRPRLFQRHPLTRNRGFALQRRLRRRIARTIHSRGL